MHYFESHETSKKALPLPRGIPKKAYLIRKRRGCHARLMHLKKQGYEVNTVDWKNVHSSNASLLVIPSPTQSLLREDVNQITQFLRNGGRLLVLNDPSSQDSLDPLLLTMGNPIGNRYPRR